MKLKSPQFLDSDPLFHAWEGARIAILPFPYEGGVSYGGGASAAPDAVIEASRYLELYDEVLGIEPFRAGISTVEPPPIPAGGEKAVRCVYDFTRRVLEQGKFVILLGGDHSISSGYFRALEEKICSPVGVIQIDAHADLRDSYGGSRFSHACVMARIREITRNTLQLGIRSMSAKEAERVSTEGLSLITMHEYRKGGIDLKRSLQDLPPRVFLTFDVDAFDWSVISSTGTPEPGGFFWDEAIELLEMIFSEKEVVGFDVVELSHVKGDRNSPFAVAKLIYKMIAFLVAKRGPSGLHPTG
jgi:agmatinase